jgi:poly-gamma-glutamate system protein
MGGAVKRLFRNVGHAGVTAAVSAQTRFTRLNSARLLSMAAVLGALWYLGGGAGLSPDENRLWERVRAAQIHMSQWRQDNGAAGAPESDPWQCGLIGLEWSAITTTLGDLAAKRTACNPAWAVQFSRWFRELGLQAGDRIAIFSSGSFPGLLLNAIAASEAMQLEPLLVVSLGASTWGANHPDIPWPVMAAELRSAGFIHHRADFYTLGGGAELGHGLSPEGQALLRAAAAESGVELLTAGDLQQMIALKMDLLEKFKPGLLINIGGSQANMGDAEEVLRLTPGPVPADEAETAGNGVVGLAMRDNIRVIHMLNIHGIADRYGIPYDAPPRKSTPRSGSLIWPAAGLVLFFIVLFTHRRWRLEPSEE